MGNESYISTPKKEQVNFISKNMSEAVATPTNKIKILKVKMKRLSDKMDKEPVKQVSKREKIEVNKRKLIIVKSRKWDDFRDRRASIIDSFIALRKKQIRATIFFKQMCVFPVLKLLSGHYQESYRRYEYKKKCSWISLKVAN